MEASTRTRCPRCEEKGRKVDHSTPGALLRSEAKERLAAGEYRFCRNGSCDVVYFDETNDVTFLTGDLKVPVFQKSADPNRPVCYCFDHTVRSIQAEVAERGTSDVPDIIGKKCKAGLDDCEHNNPQGSCCLGNVRRVVKDAVDSSGGVMGSREVPHDCCSSSKEPETMAPVKNLPSSEAHDCCAPKISEQPVAVPTKEGPSTTSRAGLLSSGGAVLGALFASACCWLPLLLIGMGASTVGVAGFFETYRPYFLVATAGLLGAGFYFVYFRKPKCAPGEACEVPNPRLQRINKVSLWLATVLVVAFATFPNYVGAFFGDNGSGTAASAQTASDVSRTYAIEGMTCEGCTGHIRTAVGALPTVKAVEVSYADGTATVVFDGDSVDDEAVIQAVASAGYTAHAPADEGGVP